jgi:CO dehydrogenase/acetyl-CoA synthase epsilon subunit
LENNKQRTFIGFSIKKRAVRIGTNAANTLRRAELLLVCPTASENAVKEALKLKRKFNCPLIRTSETLESLTGKENARIMAVTDKALAKAIIENSPTESIVEN